jgi:hypothetical protein
MLYITTMENQLMRKPLAFFGSGTNVGRVAKAARRADVYVTVPYALKEQKDSGTVIRRLACLSLPTVEELPEFTDANGFSWTKVFKDVRKASTPLKQIFRGLYGCDDENASFQLSTLSDPETGEAIDNEFTVVMHWMPQGVLQLSRLRDLVEQWVPNSLVVVLSGETTTNRQAEEEVKKTVAQAKQSHKRVIILSSLMGSRSFSVPEVEACVFMFDRGDIGSTEQRAARCLTPGRKINGEQKKVGWIVNLSLDSNRTEALTEMVLIEAQRLAKVENVDFVAALRSVLMTMNIFAEKYGVGAGLFQESDINLVIRQLRDSEKLLRVANATVNVERMNVEELLDLLTNVPPAVREGTALDVLLPAVRSQVVLEAGSGSDPTPSGELVAQLKDLQAKIERLNQSALDIAALSNYTGSSYVECLNNLDEMAALHFESSFGVDIATVRAIIEMGVLPIPILDTIVYSEEMFGVDDFWND